MIVCGCAVAIPWFQRLDNEDAVAWSRQGLIAFRGHTGVGADITVRIFVVRQDGRGLRVLTHPDPNEQDGEPAWSHDGQTMAFAHGVLDGVGRLMRVSARGGRARSLHHRGAHPAWSPDGRSIAYATPAGQLRRAHVGSRSSDRLPARVLLGATSDLSWLAPAD
jgi:Tol biopolymer transport system component